MTDRLRLSVLISGTGTNLQAIIDAREKGILPVEILRVFSNRPQAAGLLRSAQAGIATQLLDHTRFETRESFDHALGEQVAADQPDLVLLAGFMRILTTPMLQRFENRMLNLHPSLLPRHRGTDTYRKALAAGDVEHGASMHFVTAELDGGPVVSQVRIPILQGDDAASLQERLAPREHDLVVSTLALFCQRAIYCRDNRVYYHGQALDKPLQLDADGTLSS